MKVEAAEASKVYDALSEEAQPSLEEVMNDPCHFSRGSALRNETQDVTNWAEVLAAFAQPKTEQLIAGIHEKQSRYDADLNYLKTLSPEQADVKHTVELDAKTINEQKSQLKKQLGAFCFGATFGGESRSNAHARPSGFAVIDLDHCTLPPAEVWKLCRGKAAEAGVKFVFVSPSGNGLKLVIKRRCGDIWADQQQAADILGLAAYGVVDPACKDLSRLTFVSRSSDILFFDGKMDAADTLSAVPAPSIEAEADSAAEELPLVLPYDAGGFDGAAVAGQWLKNQFGNEVPPVGSRHEQLLSAAGALKYIVGFDPDKLRAILPECALPVDEVIRICEYACSQPNDCQPMPLSVKEAIEALKPEPEQPEWDESAPRPLLPPGLEELINSCPEGYRDAATLSALPCLGTLGTGIRAYSSKTHADDRGKLQTPTILALVEAPQAGGKSVITELKEIITEPLRRQDEAMLKKEHEWQEECARKSNVNKEKPKRPEIVRRLLPPTISKTELYKRQAAAGDHHMLKWTSELSEATGYRKRGDWADATSDDKKAFDNDYSGQDHAQADSFNLSVRLFYNILYLATPGELRKYLANTEDGTITRYLITGIPYELGADEPVCKQLSKDAEEKLNTLLETLQAIGNGGTKLYDLGFLDLEREAWVKKMGAIAKKTGDYALDTFRKRSAVVGFRAAMIIAACWNAEGNWTAEQQGYIKQFFHYVAHHMLHGLMIRFAADVQAQHTASFKTVQRLPYEALYNAMPQTFTTSQIAAVARQQGFERNGAKIASDWKKAGYLLSTGYGKYAKQPNPASA